MKDQRSLSRLPIQLIILFSLCATLSKAQDSLYVGVDLNPAYCGGCNGTIYLYVSGGFPPYFFTLTGGSSNITGIFDGGFYTIPNLCPDTYLLSLGGSNGQVAPTDTIVVPSLPFIQLSILPGLLPPCNKDSNSVGGVCDLVCPGATVTYTVPLPNPNPISSLGWSVQGATSYIVGNAPLNNMITVTWGGSGNGYVSVFTNDSTSCASEATRCVTIINEPESKFQSVPFTPAGSNLTLCKGQTAYFLNESVGADLYEWWFSDNLTITTDLNAQHTFFTPGTYVVRLVAKSSCLCADTSQMVITVLDAESPTLDCVGTVCPGETVNYTASGGCQPYVWSVSSNGTVQSGGTSTSNEISVIWNTGPMGTITLSALPCSGLACPTPAVLQIPIISNNAEIDGRDRVCSGAKEVYTIEPYEGTEFVWTLSSGGVVLAGQGTNKVIVEWTGNPIGNTNWLSVKYENCYLGCSGEDSIAVLILSPMKIEGPAELCEKSSGSFSSKNAFNQFNIPSNWQMFGPAGNLVWSMSNTTVVSPSFTFGVGVYRIYATPVDPNASCSDRAEWAVNAVALPTKPTGIKGDNSICPGTTYTYEALGLNPGDNAEWMVQNGAGPIQTVKGNPINVTWAATGPYQLSALKISTEGLDCKSDTARLLIFPIGFLTIAGPITVCENTEAIYTTQNYKNVNIQWNVTPASAGAFAEGQGTNVANIFWTEAGNHTINLNICGQSLAFPVSVKASPEPTIQHPVGLCAGLTAVVQTSTPYTSYEWKNDAGFNISTQPNPVLTAGEYALVVTDANGCKGTSEFSIIEYPKPNLTISTTDPTGFCMNAENVNMKALVSADADYTYQWFHDGIPVGNNSSLFTSKQYGNYTCQATNQFGCTATDGPIVVFEYCGGICHNPNHAPKCQAGDVGLTIIPTAQCDSFKFQLIPGPLYQPGSATWNFGESGSFAVGSATGENATFKFPNASQYLIVLYATLTNGAQCTLVDSVNVVAKAGFSINPGCPGDATAFDDISTFLPGYGINTWNWKFDDPSSGFNNNTTIREPAHNFASAGIYDVVLTVTANTGCTSTATVPADVPNFPAAAFNLPMARCAGNALEFGLTTTSATLTEVSWIFGDPSTGAANDAKGTPAYHDYTFPGNYTVVATATNIFGCTATSTQIVTVAPNPLTGTISPANPSPLCEGQSVTMTAPLGGTSYLWSDDNASTGATLTVSKEGTYQVTITNANGCTFVPPLVKIEIIPSPDAFIKGLLKNSIGQIIGTTTPNLTVCEGEDVSLQAFGSGSYGYQWSGGNGVGNTLDFTIDRGNALTVGDYTYTVITTDYTTGCTSESAPFNVKVNPRPSGFSIFGVGYCAGSNNTLTYSGPTPPSWQFIWNSGQTGTSIVTQEPGEYYLRVVNEFGCEAPSNSWVVLPGPQVSALPSGCHTRCKPDTLCLPNLPNIATWQWYLDGNPVSGATSANFVAQQSGTYHAVLIDAYGCTGESSPLSLNLFDGYGDINGLVWSDVNHNGMIDAADSLMSGIGVILMENGSSVGNATSNTGGVFNFDNILSTTYSVELDPTTLPLGFSAVIGQDETTLSGCDVIENAALLVDFLCHTTNYVVQVPTCAGVAVDYNGITIAAGGSEVFNLVSSVGCDSIVTVTVVDNPIISSTLSVGVCPGESYTYEGMTLDAGDSELFTLQSIWNCDSMVTVTVSQFFNAASILEVSVCPGLTYVYQGELLPPGTVKDFVLQTSEGCDSTVTISVTAFPSATFDLVATSSCATTQTGIIKVDNILGGLAPYEFSLDNSLFQPEITFDNLDQGTYTVYMQDDNDCVFEAEIEIETLDRLEVSLLNGILPCDSAGIRMQPTLTGYTDGATFTWSNGDQSVFTTIKDQGIVWVEVKNTCETVRAEAPVVWADLANDLSFVYTPNAMAPEAQNEENRTFRPLFASGLTVLNYYFAVYDRWGNLLFETKDISAGWEGFHRTKNMEPGVMVWYFEADIAICGRIIPMKRKGDISVVR